MADYDDVIEDDAALDAILNRQDEAMALLERLRVAEPFGSDSPDHAGGGRRDFRRWPTPDTVTLELHDSEAWRLVSALDIGVGGARVQDLPAWADGPVPARLKASGAPSVLVLSDVMWRDAAVTQTGLRFDFLDHDERDQWAGNLVNALVAKYAAE